MFRKNPIIMGIIIIAVVIIGGIILAAFSAKSSVPIVYNQNDQEKPVLEISEKSFDFGQMKLSQVKSKEIILKNVGARALTMWNFTTSCGCTYIELTINGEKSPRFSLHYKSSWQRDLSPGEQAILKISYQPSIMPIQGEVSRSVYFKTNDPANSNVSIDFKVYVE